MSSKLVDRIFSFLNGRFMVRTTNIMMNPSLGFVLIVYCDDN